MTTFDSPALEITPTQRADIPLLRSILLNEQVYRHIGGTPTAEDFDADLERALDGPPVHGRHPGETWLNFSLRRREDRLLLGRLEANLHDGICEVAFLLAPGFQGMGYGSAGLRWLHGEVLRAHRPSAFWAATTPDNLSSQRLLLRTGYQLVNSPPIPHLLSRDEGDLVLRKSIA